MSFDINALLAQERGRNYDLHEKSLNTQMVRVLRTIGFDIVYDRAEGPYLFDREGNRYLDLLSGFGVFALGRNHPTVIDTLEKTMRAQLPNLVQMDCGLLAGLLAERLLTHAPPGIDKVFFCNSGTEAVEGAIKFARAATRRPKILGCDHAYHGLTMGALSLNGEKIFREGFDPFLPGCESVPFNDLAALERALAKKDVAAFIVEPIQGKGVHIPSDNYLPEAIALCHRYGTLFVADEVQTGLGRTGRYFAVEHWRAEPDMVLIAKSLSGGFVPVGAILTRQWIFDKLFSRMDKAVVHGSTFAKNNLAMAAGLATLAVMEEEKLVERSWELGNELTRRLAALQDKYELLKEVRGRGMMIGIEFGSPKSLKLKAAWKMLETASASLFGQMITMPLLKKHRILSQVAGHNSYVVKLLPPFVINRDDIDWTVQAFDQIIGEAHQVPGAIWDLAKNLAGHAIKARREANDQRGNAANNVP